MIYQRPDKGSLQAWADAIDDHSYTFDNMVSIRHIFSTLHGMITKIQTAAILQEKL